MLQAGSAYRPAAAVYTDNVDSDSTDPSLNLGSTLSSSAATLSDLVPDATGKEESTQQEEQTTWVKAIYRGLIPAKNILNRDFAIAGTLVR